MNDSFASMNGEVRARVWMSHRSILGRGCTALPHPFRGPTSRPPRPCQGVFLAMRPHGPRLLGSLWALLVAKCRFVYDYLLLPGLVVLLLLLSTETVWRGHSPGRHGKAVGKASRRIHDEPVRHRGRRGDPQWDGLLRARLPSYVDPGAADARAPNQLQSAGDHEKQFVRFAMGAAIFFVTGGKRYRVESCQPCSIRFTVCPFASEAVRIVPVRHSPDPAMLARLPSGGTFNCSLTDALGPRQEFVHFEGRISFISWGATWHGLHTVYTCKPCGLRYSVCDDPGFTGERLPVAHFDARPALRRDWLREGRPFDCRRQLPQYSWGHTMDQRQPLPVAVSEAEPVRVNVLMTGVAGDLPGGTLAVMRFLDAVLARTRFGVRWVNVDGEGWRAQNLVARMEGDPSLERLRSRGEFVFGALGSTRDIPMNPGDLLMAARSFTAHVAHATVQHPRLRNKNFLYFLQDFEPARHPHNAEHLVALESYGYPHFGLYSDPFLRGWFRAGRYGQYRHMAAVEPRFSFAAEPPTLAPAALPTPAELDDPARPRRVVVYAGADAERHAYRLAVDALSLAVCAGHFDGDPPWEIVGLGASRDDVEPLGGACGRRVEMRVRRAGPPDAYRRAVRLGDVGLALVVSPHLSRAALDFVAAGLVTVTNAFGAKTPAALARVSRNFVVVQPYLGSLVEGLRVAAARARDTARRLRNAAAVDWEREWTGDRCYGWPVMRLVETWSQHTEPLWERARWAPAPAPAPHGNASEAGRGG